MNRNMFIRLATIFASVIGVGYVVCGLVLSTTNYIASNNSFQSSVYVLLGLIVVLAAYIAFRMAGGD